MERLNKLDPRYVKSIVKTALNEDIGDGDITTRNLIPPTQEIVAKIIACESGVISGLPIAKEVFKTLNRSCRWRSKFSDGDRIRKGQPVCVVKGFARAILIGERTAINFLSHMSGIATATRKFKEKARDSNISIYDTRKTQPGLRPLEKYAVTCGGGYNNRNSLDEMVLVKDNHIKTCMILGLPLRHVIKSLFTKVPRGTEIEFEAQNMREVMLAIESGVDTIMLDNMSHESTRKAVKAIRRTGKKITIEVSGNVTLANIDKLLRLDIDKISIGSITHSAPSIDFSLEICQ